MTTEAASNGKAAATYKPKHCPCGVTFTPVSGRQMYHADDCPARPQAKPTRKQRAQKRATPPARAKIDQGSILDRLAGEVGDELTRIDEQLAREAAAFEQRLAALRDEKNERLAALRNERERIANVQKALAT